MKKLFLSIFVFSLLFSGNVYAKDLRLLCTSNTGAIDVVTIIVEKGKALMLFKNSKLTEWSKIKIPLSCLTSAGLDSSNIDIRMLLLTNGNWDIDIHSIYLTDNKNIPPVDCSNLSVGIR